VVKGEGNLEKKIAQIFSPGWLLGIYWTFPSKMQNWVQISGAWSPGIAQKPRDLERIANDAGYSIPSP
jgi:hypothetical protein